MQTVGVILPYLELWDLMTVPPTPSMEEQGALGEMMGARS